VGQLECLADQVAPRSGRESERGGELGDRELRDQRCAFPGDRDPGVPATLDQPGRRLVQIIDLVQPGPLDSLLEDLGFGGVRGGSGTPRARQNGGCVDGVGARTHDFNLWTTTDRKGPDSLAGMGIRENL
jgi:hypothetical protein